MSYLDDRYINPDFNPSDSIVSILKVNGTVPMRRMAKEVPAESSVGTWTTVRGLTDDIFERLAARTIEIDEKNGIIKVAYPRELFEVGSLPQMLSILVGNIFGMKIVKTMRLIDVIVPESIQKQFPGPELGVKGVQEKLEIDVNDPRPVIGTIVKPKMGLPVEEHAQIAYEAWYGGVDFVKDDEPQTDQPWIRFEDRITQVLDKGDKVWDETGRKVMYAANITGRVDHMLERADIVKSNGGKNGATCIMMDVLTTGFSALQYIREQKYGLAIHGHRAMHATVTMHPEHGIHMTAMSKWLRLAGVDTLHAGSVVGKMEGDREDTTAVYNALRSPDWILKPVVPVASGGLHPGSISPLVDLFGTDILINAGGGVHGHPDGTIAGGRALRQALNAKMAGRTLREYAEENKLEELTKAIDFWAIPREI